MTHWHSLNTKLNMIMSRKAIDLCLNQKSCQECECYVLCHTFDNEISSSPLGHLELGKEFYPSDDYLEADDFGGFIKKIEKMDFLLKDHCNGICEQCTATYSTVCRISENFAEKLHQFLLTIIETLSEEEKH